MNLKWEILHSNVSTSIRGTQNFFVDPLFCTFGPENNRIFSISQSTKLWSRPETRASRYGEGAYTEKAKDIINFQETVARAAEKRSKLQVYCKCVASILQVC